MEQAESFTNRSVLEHQARGPMKRIFALLSSLLAVAACSISTAPDRPDTAAKTAQAKAALDSAATRGDNTPTRLSAN